MGKLILVKCIMIENNLKDAREELEMTQKELGFVFGVSPKTISGWETASDPIPFNKLIKFCNLYNYSLDYLLKLDNKTLKCFIPIKTDRKKIGDKLKEIRTSLNLSQEAFAHKCGISQTTYSHYETGLNLITTSTAYTICKVYHISLDYLVGRIK